MIISDKNNQKSHFLLFCPTETSLYLQALQQKLIIT